MGWTVNFKSFKQYLLLERRLSPHTVEAYLRDVKKFIGYIEEESITSVNQVTSQDIQSFVSLLTKIGMARSSQARIISSIKGFFQFMVIEDMIATDPSELIETPKQIKKLPVFLNLQEVQLMLDAIDLSSPEGHRNRAILEVLYACGLRVSELINLKITNLFFDVGYIRVIGKNNKERLVPIGDSAIKMVNYYLTEYRQQQLIQPGYEDVLFLNRRGKGLTRNMIFIIVQNTAKQAGIQKRVSPHTFRHSFATHLVENGANIRAVQSMLGHESITTTEIYTHVNNQHLKDAILNFHPLYDRDN